MKVLVLNAGSSSKKSALFELGHDIGSYPAEPRWEGKLQWNGRAEVLTIRNLEGKKIQEQRGEPGDRNASVEVMLRNVWDGPSAVIGDPQAIDIIGHRIVHGGPKLADPVLIDERVKRTITDVAEIAPLHNQAGLRGIEIAQKLFPGKPQVAVFDTGFHRTLPAHAAVYPGPYEWFESGIRRYGFHGINHQYCAQRAAQVLGRDPSTLRIVSCHLGNGCSLAAIKGGESVETTMGFTPLEGLMMGTRAGSVDPGILIRLLRTSHMDAEALDDVLNRRSGLLGISGVSSDMREVLQAANQGNSRAKLAFDIFVHRLRQGIAAMAGSLGGIDAIVFTAGIGENSAEVRQAACAKLRFLGVQLDQAANSSPKPDVDVAAPNSAVRVLVIRAQEDWAIAKECVRLAVSTPDNAVRTRKKH